MVAMPVSAATDQAQILIDTEARVQSNPGAWRRWFVLRLAGIYGPGRHHLLEQVRAGEVAGTGEHHLNLIHRDDVVSAIAACITAAPDAGNEILNVADDGRARKDEVVHWLAHQLAENAATGLSAVMYAHQLGLPAPRFTGRIIGRRAATPDRVIANDRLKARLGWRPRYPTFRDGYANLLSH